MISLTKTGLSACQKAYADYLKDKTPAYARFAAKKGKVTITAYESGKVVFQGADAAHEADRWSAYQQKQQSPKAAAVNEAGRAKSADNQGTKKQHSHAKAPADTLPKDFANWSVIGSDEVGAGAYFGPLTTAAVYVPAERIDWVKRLGIADSKNMTDAQIKEVAPQLIQHLAHHVINLGPHKYNQLQAAGTNIVAMKALSHNFVLTAVQEKIAPEQADAMLIDQFVQASTYFRYLKKGKQEQIAQQHVYFATKGEGKHVAVAAASVLARYVELQEMTKLGQAAGLNTALPIGAGKQADQVAATLVQKGYDLEDFAKVHFANTAKVQALVNKG